MLGGFGGSGEGSGVVSGADCCSIKGMSSIGFSARNSGFEDSTWRRK